jgi:hypothetical protein
MAVRFRFGRGWALCAPQDHVLAYSIWNTYVCRCAVRHALAQCMLSYSLSLSLSLSLHLFPLIRSYSQSFSPCKPSTSHRALSGGRWNGTRMESGSVQRAPKANCNASRGKMTRTCVLLRGNAPVGGIPPEQENQRVSTVYSCSCCRTFPLPSTNRFLFICIYFEEAH